MKLKILNKQFLIKQHEEDIEHRFVSAINYRLGKNVHDNNSMICIIENTNARNFNLICLDHMPEDLLRLLLQVISDEWYPIFLKNQKKDEIELIPLKIFLGIKGFRLANYMNVIEFTTINWIQGEVFPQYTLEPIKKRKRKSKRIKDTKNGVEPGSSVFNWDEDLTF